MVNNIFSLAPFKEIILPFLLVFTLVFAILEKSKVLGDGKRQLNAIIALAVGLLLLAADWQTKFIVTLTPFLAIAAVVVLIFMLLYGFVGGTDDKGNLPKGLKIAIGIIIGAALVVAILLAAGVWGDVVNFFSTGKWAEAVWVNVVFIAIVIAAVAAVIFSGKGK